MSHFQITYFLHTCFDFVLYYLPMTRRVKQTWAAWPLQMGPIGCLETSVTNYQSTLRNIPEEQKSHLHLGRSLILSIQENLCIFWHLYKFNLNTIKGPQTYIRVSHKTYLLTETSKELVEEKQPTLLCSIYWLLHVSAVVCHHQGASWICLSYLKYRSKRWYII
jgi:hypothetical protein